MGQGRRLPWKNHAGVFCLAFKTSSSVVGPMISLARFKGKQ